jgi:FtsP/CotA-like multicopper oxidase with cupredoxin domain
MTALQKIGGLSVLAIGLMIFIVLMRMQTDITPVLNDTPQLREALREEFDGSFALTSTASGVVQEFDLRAAESSFELTKGITISSFAYNEQIPGPELRVALGATVKVNFRNDLPQPTTIHWHGVRVPNAMDGVPGVTQEPIEPGESFVYEFTPKDPGTFWFHPHVRGSEQVEKGLYGVLIVEDPEDPEYTQDVVWVVDDWRITPAGKLDERFNTGHDLSHDGRWGNVITVNGSVDEQLHVKPGERIRLRLVNVSNARVYVPDFSPLEAGLIAADGMPVSGVSSATGIELAPGNRIDVDITVPTGFRGKTITVTDTFTRATNRLGQIIVADEDAVSTPAFDYPLAKIMPLWSTAVEADVDAEYVLDARRGGEYGIEWTINGKTFPEAEAITLRSGEFEKIRFTNESARLHPMHLHGQFFKVLARNGKPVNEGFWRDTVLLKRDETVDVGLVPVDEGEWANHCHTLEHAEAGMMTTVIVE